MADALFRFQNRTESTDGQAALALLATTMLNKRIEPAADMSRLPNPRAWTPKKATILTNRDSFVLPYTDPKVTHSDVARRKWVEIDRPGNKSVIADGGEKLRKLRMSAIVGSIGRDASYVEGALENLRYMLSVPEPLTIAYGRFEEYGVFWRCQSAEFESVQREAGTNNIWWASVDLSFIEDNPAPYPQPVVNTPAPIAAMAASPAPPAPAGGQTYVVAKGDTLWGIAQKFYRNGAEYPRIAAANGIRDPRKLGVGQRLVIP